MQNRKAIVFIGPKGCGSKEYVRHLSTRIRAGKPLVINTSEVLAALSDRRIAHQMKAKRLIADSVVIKAVGRYIKENGKKARVLLFNGFPSTEGQASFISSERGHRLLDVDSIIIVEMITPLAAGPKSRSERRKELADQKQIALLTRLLTKTNTVHLCIKPIGNMESTNRAILESVLPYLQIRAPQYNPAIPLLPQRAPARTSVSA